MRLRVALGPIDVAGLASALADELTALGADVDVVLSQGSFAFPTQRVVRRVPRLLYGLGAGLRRDVLHFHFGVSWAPVNVDAAWARLWRRTLVASYFGDDCRLAEVARARFAARGRVTDPARDGAVRGRLERLGRLCHAGIAGDMELATYLRPFFERIYLVPVPVRPPSAAVADARRRDSGKPVVVHIPSDPAIKGTRRIQDAVEAVARRLPLEFRLLRRVVHDDAMRALADADVVVDQLNSVTTGVLAVEAMQLGLPVLSEIDRRALAPFQEESPVVAVTPESLEAELESLLRDPDRRADLGERGRAFVSRVHAAPKVAAAVLNVYRHARDAEPGLYEADGDAVRRLDWPN